MQQASLKILSNHLFCRRKLLKKSLKGLTKVVLYTTSVARVFIFRLFCFTPCILRVGKVVPETPTLHYAILFHQSRTTVTLKQPWCQLDRHAFLMDLNWFNLKMYYRNCHWNP